MPPDAPIPPSLEPLFSADVWNLHFRASPWPRPLDVHTRNRTGETPLMMAAGYQCSAIAPLLALGADLHAVDRNGWTPLFWACQNRQEPEAVRLLIEAGAQVNVQERSGLGNTALIDAAHLVPDAVGWLLAAGADPEACNHDGLNVRACLALWKSTEHLARFEAALAAHAQHQLDGAISPSGLTCPTKPRI